MLPFPEKDSGQVHEEDMQRVYEALRTPYKVGAVLKLEEAFTDSPSVFRHKGRWYMYYISISKDCSVSGYITHLAVSDDLLHWEQAGDIFHRNEDNHWDSKQIAGYAALPDIDFYGSGELRRVNGKYYVSYLAGNSDGYEPDPLYMGLAETDDPVDGSRFRRFEKPILSPDAPDGRLYETKTLYKSFIFIDDQGITGHRYVNAYNAKHTDNTERIFLAVSDDMEHWERFGDRPVVDDITGNPNAIICGDPQILRMGELYVMVYFRLDKGKSAYNTFACSRDLLYWTRWRGRPLIESEQQFEDCHAHKPWIVCADGMVYHFYCAVNSHNERFIALATSRPMCP